MSGAERAPSEPARTAAPAELDESYIAAVSPASQRRPRTLKHGDTFGVFDHAGDIVAAEGSHEGLYHHDMRHVSELRLLVDGQPPLLLGSGVLDNNAVLAVDLTNPDLAADGQVVLARDTVHLQRSRYLWRGELHERLAVRSHDLAPRRIELAVCYAADFRDLFEIRGHERPRRGQQRNELLPDGVIFEYCGLDGIARRSVIRFDPAPARHDEKGATFVLELEPGGRSSIFLAIACEEGPPANVRAEPPRFMAGLREARRALRDQTRRRTRITTSNAILDEILARSASDLAMLVTDTEHGPYPYAGIPWFCTAFGRDAIITAIETLWVDPEIAKGVLLYLAATQAAHLDPEADAEPGKILHETRACEMARTGEVPFALYYGSVDSTPLFVVLAGLYLERTRDLATVLRLWPHVEAALRWIDRYGDSDGDGFVEYRRQRDSGLTNQGWKDSIDSVFHADGSLAQGAIALCEVQAYVFDAKLRAASIAGALGLSTRAQALRLEADAMRERFERVFWCERIGTYALALDGEKRPCEVRSSNAGHALFSGIASEERAEAVARQLMGREFFTGWGIRTIGTGEARYNPMSYHNGSVWPHDNALIGLGFARYGLKAPLVALFRGLADTAAATELRRLPELFCGFRRGPGRGPTSYPVACTPQAWACAAPYALLQACLGLELDAASEIVRFHEPRLPEQVDELAIHGLAIGPSRLDLLLRRYGADVSVNVLARSGGDAQVIVRL